MSTGERSSTIEAMKHYEAALKAAFPKGASGEVFKHWNEARKALEQAERYEEEKFKPDWMNYQEGFAAGVLEGREQMKQAAQSATRPATREEKIVNQGVYEVPVAAPAQEFVCSTGLCHFTLTQTNVGIGERGMEAYEAAKKRGWVGLSDERLMEMPKQEPVSWKNAAIRLGEELSSVGPDGYYNMTAEQWLDWAMDQRPRGKNSLPAAHRPVVEPHKGIHATPWRGLTDEERSQLYDKHYLFSLSAAISDVEAKLKEKNA